MRLKETKTKSIGILLVSIFLAGCSFQDLMFWKKNKQEPQEQRDESKQED